MPPSAAARTASGVVRDGYLGAGRGVIGCRCPISPAAQSWRVRLRSPYFDFSGLILHHKDPVADACDCNMLLEFTDAAASERLVVSVCKQSDLGWLFELYCSRF